MLRTANSCLNQINCFSHYIEMNNKGILFYLLLLTSANEDDDSL